ncbi:hypothetical protein Vafri_15356, partial [Volvox africanus]
MRLQSCSSLKVLHGRTNRCTPLQVVLRHPLLLHQKCFSYNQARTSVTRNTVLLAGSGGMAMSSEPGHASLEYWFGRSGRYEKLLVDGTGTGDGQAAPVQPVAQSDLKALLGSLDPLHRTWATNTRFKAKPGELCLLPDPMGGVARVLLGIGPASTAPWPYAALAKLPGGTYRLTPPQGNGSSATDSSPAAAADPAAAYRAALGFLLGHYAFERYKTAKRVKGAAEAEAAEGDGYGGAVGSCSDVEEVEESKARLVWPEGCDRAQVLALVRAFVWCRDLITTPAEDLGPQHLAAEAQALAVTHGSVFSLLQGEQLLEANYPAIHTVGRASYRPPVLATLEWFPPGEDNPASLPLLALVGKGVCFDTGGLNLKSGASMKNMKKDMGGAALVLALAHVVMSCRLRVRLLVLVPAVENSVAGNSYRPLDVLQTRAGITVENGNCDAEGRLILSDALTEAASRRPDLILDAATLTGAARTALGAELPAVFTNDDATWRELEAAAEAESDHLWRLPLHAPYRRQLDSKVADLASTGAGDGLAGAILAALFLQEFVKGAPRWIHIDTSAFTAGSAVGPGRPEG